MTQPKDGSSLTPDEVRALGLKQLAESGIVESELDALKIGFLTATAIRQNARALPFAAAPGILHTYFHSDGKPSGLQRIRYLRGYEPPDPKKPGKFMRYGHPPGKPPELYLAPTVPWSDIFLDPSVELFFTEGWLKALAAVKFLSIPVLAYDGINSFWKNGLLLPVYNEIVWRGRKVTLLNDKDVPGKPDSLRGENAHARLLTERNATVFVARYPANSKVGKLDDALIVQREKWVQQYLIAKAVEWEPTAYELDGIPNGLEEEPLRTPLVIPPLSDSAMYGIAKKLTEDFELPRSLTYPAVLAMLAAANLPTAGETRGTLYVVLINTSGGGKSVITSRVEALVSSQTRLLLDMPVSDRGLLNMLKNNEPAAESTPRKLAVPSSLLICDEMDAILSKANIENATLYQALNELFYRDDFGVSDRKGITRSSPTRFNLLANLPCKNPLEFSEKFGSSSQSGLYRRCIFGLGLSAESFVYKPASPKLKLHINPSGLIVPREMYSKVEEWKGKDEEQRERRKNLSELILRVALITASANGDKKITPEAFEAAREFMEWQEKIRMLYAPARSRHPYAQCMDMVMDYFEKSTGLINWRNVAKSEHWYGREFSHELMKVKNNLISDGVLVASEQKGLFYYRKGEVSDKPK
jgi:hypothetical protein